MAKLTLQKALKLGVPLPRLPLPAMVAVQERGWISDERKLSGDPNAVFVVVECGDDAELADYLRSLGTPVVALQHGWWSRAVSPDHNAEKSFSISALRFEPVRFKDGMRKAWVVHAHGWKWDPRGRGRGPYVAHVAIDLYGYVFFPETVDRRLHPHVRSPDELRRNEWLAADFYISIDPDTYAVFAAPPGYDSRAWTGDLRRLGCAIAVDGLRRARLHPEGEGPQR